MNISLIQNILQEMNRDLPSNIRLMEVCGTHTGVVVSHGLSSLLNQKIQLLSGPGCPVCVTAEQDINNMIHLSKQEGIVLATFGDMMRVPGKEENLSQMKEKGYKIQVIYSPLDVLELAENNRDQQIVFLGVGFETTAPLIAATIKNAKQRNIHNLSFYLALKQMEPVLQAILREPGDRPHGIICPGHVAAIMGADYFKFIVDQYGLPAVICGFEPEDMIAGIYCLIKQLKKEHPLQLENLYRRCVKPQGNKTAKDLLRSVFQIDDAVWRGIGKIPMSGYRLNKVYEAYDAIKVHTIVDINATSDTDCLCSDILLGKKRPKECPFFNKECTPGTPKGPCMVSREGACWTYYNYEGGL